MLQRSLGLLLVVSFAISSLTLPAYADAITTDAEVVVIGDIHGAYGEVTALLQELKVIDSKLNWIGGKRHLVSLGDLVDRGADSRKVVELMMKLKSQAEQAGGGYSQLLGNHEIMLMTGDYRYVSEAEFAAFKDMADPELRQHLFDKYSALFKQQNNIQAEFEQDFPLGFTGLMKAYSPQGEIGKWLRENGRAVVKINNQLFVHGGISTETSNKTIAQINDEMHAALADYQQHFAPLVEVGILPFSLARYSGTSTVEAHHKIKGAKRQSWYKAVDGFLQAQESILFSAKGPFWYRGNAFCPELLESYAVEKAQKKYRIEQIIVGHSVKYRRLVSRVDGAVILADTGMLSTHYQGTPSALVFDGEQTKGHHLSNKFSASIVAESAKFRWNPAGMSDDDVEDFLLNAEVIENKPIGEGITRSRVLTLRQGEITLRAAFKTINDGRDSYRYEIAAYKLDRLLDQHLVPPVVERTINRRTGAVQLWIEDMITENNRSDRRIEYQGMCEEIGWTRLLLNFDTLIYNIDRNNGNILWDKDFFNVFIDHSQAFGTSVGVPKMYRRSTFRLSEYHKQRLQSLTIERLNPLLSDYLSGRQISAIIQRRDYILNKAS